MVAIKVIAIKDMDMPAECATCEFSGRFTHLCNLVHREYYGKQGPRADWCPLVEINTEVVRCKDCKHYNAETKGCKRNPSVEGWEEDDFCSYGGAPECAL